MSRHSSSRILYDEVQSHIPPGFELNHLQPEHLDVGKRLQHTSIPANSLRRFHKNDIRAPGRVYDDSIAYSHHDAFNRYTRTPMKDAYISSKTGGLRELIVQCSQHVYQEHSDVTWARTNIKNATSWTLRLSGWPYRALRNQGAGMAIIAWIIASLALLVTLLVPVTRRSHGSIYAYRSFPYRFRGYAKSPRNPAEARSEGKQDTGARGDHNRRRQLFKRAQRPHRLCIKKQQNVGGWPYETLTIEQWQQRRSDSLGVNSLDFEEYPKYLFISYTGEQFNDEEDIAMLEYLSGLATEEAGLEAFWLSSHCLAQDDEDDVYRINDYVRMSSGVAIILGHPPNLSKHLYDRNTLEDLLHQWAKRVWTFPEILLAPNNQPIQVWVRGREDNGPELLHKTRFPEMAWSDSELSRVLVDDMENTLSLSRLERSITALKCFENRSLLSGSKEFHYPGDRAYAMAGLLSERPPADASDSEFQAFARLSLANDSDRLLERLICTLPKSPETPWHKFEDAWDANLWDIYPNCHVSGIGADDTVILDGAKGASIYWKRLRDVRSIRRPSWLRSSALSLLHLIPASLFSSILMLALSGSVGGSSGDDSASATVSSVLRGIGGALLAISLISTFAAPKLVQTLYTGKSYGNECWLFGIEGYMSIPEIERNIWGDATRRLQWSPYSSPLSRHFARYYDDKVECQGTDPFTDSREPLIRNQIADLAGRGMRLFTLVDTHTMTVTLFTAERPPVALLVCGEEGGMQRAVGVSYDWTTETLYRETVLRMESTVLDKMSRVSRCQIGLERPRDGKWATSAVNKQ